MNILALQPWAHPKPESSSAYSSALEQSWENPSQFWQSLFGFGCQQSAKQSHLEHSYAWYFDLVIAHLGQNKTALMTYERTQAKKTTFEALHQYVCGLIAQALHEIEPGHVVAIDVRNPLKREVALLAMLKIGATIVPIHTETSYLKAKQLQSVQPDYVITDVSYEAIQTSSKVISLSADMAMLEHNLCDYSYYRYGADVDVVQAFLPSTDLLIPKPFKAHSLYLNILRDALLYFNADQAKQLTICEHRLTQFAPYVIWGTWLLGGTFVALPQSETESSQILARETFGTLVLGPKSLAHQLKEPRALSAEHYIRLLSDSNLSDWHFAKPNFNPLLSLHYDASLGGVTLAGLPHGQATNQVLPGPGCPWEICSDQACKQKSFNQSGYLKLALANLKNQSTSLYLTKHGQLNPMLTFVADMDPKRFGFKYPEALVSDVLNELFPEAQFACAKIKQDPGYRIILVALNPNWPQAVEQQNTLKEVLLTQLRLMLGDQYLPDEIVLFSTQLSEAELSQITTLLTNGSLAKTQKH